MSSTNDQPPLTRRQVRDLERAREAGEAITGSISTVSGSPVPSNMPVTTPSPASHPATHRPGSHVAPPSSVVAPAPASAPYGDSHAPTRRELRAQREAAAPQPPTPVPLKAPKPASDRNLSDALSQVADLSSPATTPRTASQVPAAAAGAPSAAAPTAPAASASAASAPVTPAPADARGDASPASPSSPPQAGTPGPRAFRRDSGSVGVGVGAGPGQPVDMPSGSDSGPVRRRSGGAPVAAPASDKSAASSQAPVSSSTPPPTSTPTVFPFALSGIASPSSPTSGPTTVVDASRAASSTAGDETGAGGSATEASAPAATAPAAAASAAAASSGPVAAPVAQAPAPSAPTSQATAAGTPAGGPADPAAAPAARRAPAAEPRRTPSIPASVPDAGRPATATPYVPPTGHWSTQADVDDDTIDTVGSHFSSSTGQHNALIVGDDSLPDVTGALNATGEVIITGSIDLPRSLSATGSHNVQRIDGADIDRMLEEGDREAPANDATPVRASRAVSANTSTRAVVLAAGKPKSNRLPIVGMVCGVVVIVVIVGLVVWGLTSGVLSH